MRFFSVLLFLFLLTSTSTFAQRDLIEWNDTLQLSVEDYKGGITSADTSNHISSSCGLYCIPQITGDTASITIIAYFDRNKSWARRKRVTPLLLQHEKGHFDLTEIFARKLKKRILAMKTNKSTFVKDVRKVYDKTWEDLQKQHQAYDRATEFSNVEFAQRTWQNFIKENLVHYHLYSSQTIRFPIRD
jgi:hypothetical protein